jgi:hypothetical protein
MGSSNFGRISPRYEGERIGNGSEASTMVRYATFRRFVDADADADAGRVDVLGGGPWLSGGARTIASLAIFVAFWEGASRRVRDIPKLRAQTQLWRSPPRTLDTCRGFAIVPRLPLSDIIFSTSPLSLQLIYRRQFFTRVTHYVRIAGQPQRDTRAELSSYPQFRHCCQGHICNLFTPSVN